MKVHRIALFIMVGAILFAPVVSAKIIEEKDGYQVSAADASNEERDLFSISALISDSIRQGELDSYSRYVNSGTTAIISDLNWGDTSDSLSLTLVAPDSTFGPYYDNADGRTDGRIFISISKSSGVASGTWWNRIYGSQVTGSEDYTFESF